MEMMFACTALARLRGLLGRCRFSGALMLTPCQSVHTFGMRAPIDVAFVARDGTVLETRRSVPPNRVLVNRCASSVVERFASEDSWFTPGDRLQVEVLSGSARGGRLQCGNVVRTASQEREGAAS